jgi:hypothetical protein
VLAVLLVVATVISSAEQSGRVASSTSVIYDKQFVDALYDVSSFVPEDDVIVASTNSPYVTFFTGHYAKIPFGVSSRDTLVEYMLDRSYRHLLVFEGNSQVPELERLFSSSGLVSLEGCFSKLTTIQTDLKKVHLYRLDLAGNGELPDLMAWRTFTVEPSNIKDRGTPLISAVDTIQIRIVDDGTGPVSVWLGRLSLVDVETGDEIVIDDFESGHGYRLQSRYGVQEDDLSESVNGTQSLRLTTEGNGEGVFTRKSKISPPIDFAGKTVKLWVKIDDPIRLLEFRVTVTCNDFEDYRNYWIFR